MAHKRYGEMTPEEYQIALRRNKYYKNMRALGHSARATREEFEALKVHIRRLLAAGMSYQEIAREAGTSASAPREVMARHKAVRRTTLHKIMAVHPEGEVDGWGRRDPLKARRMLQAMQADGYSQLYLAGLLNRPKNTIWKWSNKRIAHIEVRNETLIQQAYDKLNGTNPLENGMALQAMANARNTARKKGFAPSHCWDSDTIGDPESIPEWTGACGTQKGYNIHYNEGVLPICRPCAYAHYLYNKEMKKRGSK